MRSYSSNFPVSHDLGLLRSHKKLSFAPRFVKSSSFFSPNFCRCRQLHGFDVLKQGYSLQHNVILPRSMDEGSLGISSFDDWGNNDGISDCAIISSDGEDSDGEILVTPINDVDMPTIKNQFVTSEDALTTTAHRLAMLGRRHKKYRISYGFVTNLGLITFLTFLLTFVDWCAWRIVRLPLDNFYFLSPFLASAFLVACAGYVSVPILKRFNIRQKFKRKWSAMLYSKKGTPTIGGLFFIPIGVAVAKVMSGSSTEVSGMLAVTLAFAAVGLLDDVVGLVNYHNFGLCRRTRFLLEVAVAAWFSYWLYTKNISSPYGMKLLVPLPAPFGLVNLGKYYLIVTSFSFVLMANGHSLTDCLDGLAGGTSALAFVGMSIAVLPICSDLSVFGASMAGACVGFLLHNRYKASVSMGKTGSLALGGALAGMASCSGMFFPLFIASGFSVLEVLAVIIQIVYSKVTESIQGKRHRLITAAPLHQNLEFWGIGQQSIVAGAYIISSLLAVLAGYVGLVSA